MEFETSPPPKDEERELAVAKKVELAPMHSDIAPEPDPAEERNAEATPIGNIDIDSENTVSQEPRPEEPLQVSEKPEYHWKPIVAAIGALTVFAAIVIFVVYLSK